MLSVVVERICPARTSSASHSLRWFLTRRTSIRIDVSSSNYISSRAAASSCASSRSPAEAHAPTPPHRELARDDPHLSRQECRFPESAAAFSAARLPGRFRPGRRYGPWARQSSLFPSPDRGAAGYERVCFSWAHTRYVPSKCIISLCARLQDKLRYHRVPHRRRSLKPLREKARSPFFAFSAM